MATIRWWTVPAGTKPVPCNGPHCGRAIYFVHNPQSGRTVPVDCDVEGGRRPSVARAADPNQIGMLGVDQVEVHDGRGHSHFTTCPDAGQFSRRVL